MPTKTAPQPTETTTIDGHTVDLFVRGTRIGITVDGRSAGYLSRVPKVGSWTMFAVNERFPAEGPPDYTRNYKTRDEAVTSIAKCAIAQQA